MPGLPACDEAHESVAIGRGRLDRSRFQQGPKHAVNFPVTERLPFIRNEDVVATALRLLPVDQIVSQSGYGGCVQRHQSSFLKLGFAD